MTCTPGIRFAEVCTSITLQARHDKLGGPRPALSVVSYHADDTNRAPTFDIDLDDLFEPDGEASAKMSAAYCGTKC